MKGLSKMKTDYERRACQNKTTLEEDLDYHIGDHSKDSKRDKSHVAYAVMVRFDQVIDSISKGEDNLEGFTRWGFIPPSLRAIVKGYVEEKVGKTDTLRKIRENRKKADLYLRERGFNPDLARKEEEKDDKRALNYLKKMAKYRDKELKEVDKMIDELHSTRIRLENKVRE